MTEFYPSHPACPWDWRPRSQPEKTGLPAYIHFFGRGIALHRFCLLIALWTVVAAVTGCHPCQAYECSDALTISILEPGNGTIEDGVYEFEVVANGMTYVGSCTGENEGHSANCDLKKPLSLHAVQSGTGEVDAVLKYFHIDFPFQGDTSRLPSEVALSVSHDGQEVASVILTPEYTDVDPACHPGCVSDSFRIEMNRG